MGVRVQQLLALQDVENQILDIRRQLQRRERAVALQQKKVQAAQAALEGERKETQRAQIEFDTFDLDIKGRSANIEKLREHLNTVRTNKDYHAVLAQLNNERADLSKLEARAMEMMVAIDSRKSAHPKLEAAEKQEQARLEELKAELEQARAAVAGRLAKLETERKLAAKDLEPAVLTLFERLSERYDGETLAEVQQPNPRSDIFICGGCHLTLVADVPNALKVKDDIVTCKSCGRILYLKSHAAQWG